MYLRACLTMVRELIAAANCTLLSDDSAHGFAKYTLPLTASNCLFVIPVQCLVCQSCIPTEASTSGHNGLRQSNLRRDLR